MRLFFIVSTSLKMVSWQSRDFAPFLEIRRRGLAGGCCFPRCWQEGGRENTSRGECRSATPLGLFGVPRSSGRNGGESQKIGTYSCFYDMTSYSVMHTVCSSEGPCNETKLIPYLTFLCMFLRKKKVLSNSYGKLRVVLSPYVQH